MLEAKAERQSCAVYAITLHGIRIAETLCAAVPDAHLYVSEKLLNRASAAARPVPLPMGPLLADTFARYNSHVFVISIGAVVRMIAPLLRNKKVDPAVICVDDVARYAVCVLSGHVGRGNEITERVAIALGAQPVITTASDVTGTLTVDILGRELGWQLDDADRNVTRGCAAVVNQQSVLIIQQCGERTFWPLDKPLPTGVSYTTTLDDVVPDDYDMLLIISDRELRASHPEHWARSVIYRPKTLILGLGCDKDTPVELVERGVATLLARHRLSPKSVRGLATIEQKRHEPALVTLSERHAWPLHIYSPAQLDVVPGIQNPSETVRRHVGAWGVAEPAALLAAGADTLLVSKQTYTEPGAGRSMTFAVARVPHAPRPSTPAVIAGESPVELGRG